MPSLVLLLLEVFHASDHFDWKTLKSTSSNSVSNFQSSATGLRCLELKETTLLKILYDIILIYGQLHSREITYNQAARNSMDLFGLFCLLEFSSHSSFSGKTFWWKEFNNVPCLEVGMHLISVCSRPKESTSLRSYAKFYI